MKRISAAVFTQRICYRIYARRSDLRNSSCCVRRAMVFGPLLDVRKARREGKSMTHVWAQGQQLINSRLPFPAKLAFWLTNVPYYAVAARLICGPLPLAAGAPWTHAVCMVLIALASTGFHGASLFGSPTSTLPSRLLVCDLLFANGYAVYLGTCVGIARMLRVFGVPVLFLAGSASLKRRGSVAGYAWGHGIWHILSAAAMWSCLFVDAGS